LTQVTLPNLSKRGANEDWNHVEGNDQAIADVVNGGLDATNLASNAVTTAKITDANVTDAKLASPNNSVYKTLLFAQATTLSDAPAGTYLISNAGLAGSPADIITTGSGLRFPPLIYFDNDDFTVGSLTQKLRLRAQVSTNATAWSAVTATFGLYPVTFAGAADTLTATLGTVVSGSTVPIANPSASATAQGNSGDFTIPSDGQYCLGVVTSATLTNNVAALLTAQLQTRNV